MNLVLKDERGGMVLGVAVGFLLMISIGWWIPILGSLLAGLVAGILARGGVSGGALAGFLSGIMGAIILGLWVMIVGLAKLGPLSGLLDALLGGLTTFGAALIASAGVALFGLIGGIIGGAMVEKG